MKLYVLCSYGDGLNDPDVSTDYQELYEKMEKTYRMTLDHVSQTEEEQDCHFREENIMIKTFTIETGQKLTEEQLEEISEAKKYPIVFDDDCPELSPAIIKDTVHFLCHRTMLLLFFHS